MGQALKEWPALSTNGRPRSMGRRYITENTLQEWGERKKNRKKKEDGCSSYHPWKLLPLSTKEQRRRGISPWTKPEDKLLPFLHTFDHSISLWSCPTVAVLTKAQFLSPFSLPNLLHQVRWVWAHSPNSKEPPKSGPYNWRRLWEELVCWWEQQSNMVGSDPHRAGSHQPESARSQQTLSMAGTKRMEGFGREA